MNRKSFIFLLIFALLPGAISAQTNDYPVRVAVLDAKLDFPTKNPALDKLARVYQLSLPEVFSQDLKKIPGVLVLDRESFRGALTDDLSQVKLKELVPFGLNYVIQVSFSFPEKSKIEMQANILNSQTGEIAELKKLLGPEAKVLEMIDTFTLSVADYLKKTLTEKQVEWIQKRNSVSTKALIRYGKGLEFYWKQTKRGAVLAREQFRKAEFYDLLFVPTYVAQAKTSLFLYEQFVPSEEILDYAYENLRKALFTDSNYLDAYLLLSYIYYLKGNYVDSIREGFRALRLKPMSVEARLNLAKSYIKLNKYTQAKEQLNKILELDPTHKEARSLLTQ